MVHAQALGHEGKTPDDGTEQEEQIGFQVPGIHLLIAEAVLPAAIRALPGDAVAGHAPYILMHARLADQEAAAAAPAKGNCFGAAVACFWTFLPAPGSVGRMGCGIIHRLAVTG
jgi:hypothetical protein